MRKTKRLTLCAVLIALALALSYTERFIPLQMVVPLPGVKLGLANIVTLVALYLLGPKEAFAILMPRCILGAVFGGGITGLLFSLTGGVLAMAVMILAKKVPFFSVYGVSILGAAAHNVGQILVAMAVLETGALLYYLPILVVSGLAAGIVTGIISGILIKRVAPVFRENMM